MDRLAEQLVEWHNSHPLARRISIFDVHTIGVVGLPFLRSGRPAAAQVEPALAPEPVHEHTTLAPDEHAQAASAATAPKGAGGLGAKLKRLLPSPAARGAAGDKGWPLFSERFINRLSPRRIAKFALAHGYTTPPGEADWPQRTIEIDEDLMVRVSGKAAGAWPVELYLITAGIDAGPARTRVLLSMGSGNTLHVLGRRCLDPQRLLLAVGLPALLLALGAATLWWKSRPHEAEAGADAPALAASAAASAAAMASAPLAASSPAATPAAETASAAALSPDGTAASAVPSGAASAAAAAEPAASQVPFIPSPQGIPDIRPQLKPPGPRPSAPAMSSDATPPAESRAKPEARPDTKAEAKPEGKPEPKSEPKREAKLEPDKREAAAPPSAPATPAKALGALGTKGSKEAGSAKPQDKGSGSSTPAAAPDGRQVALVGPASRNKADAEATLARMSALLGQTVRDPSSLHAQVFQTKEGWRPAVWPFPSREQAQLVNATLIASGLRTRAVDF
jgi:hypothetical protein